MIFAKIKRFFLVLYHQFLTIVSFVLKFVDKYLTIILIPFLIVLLTKSGTLNVQNIVLIVIAAILISLRSKLISLFLEKEYDVEVINRNKQSSFLGYANLLKIIGNCSNSVYIISPPKSKEFLSSSRQNYIEELDKIIESKARNDKAFEYKRLIPVSNKAELNDDDTLFQHHYHIASTYADKENINSSIIDELHSTYNFVMVDSKILILFFPRIEFKSNGDSVGDYCSHHLILTYKNVEYPPSLGQV